MSEFLKNLYLVLGAVYSGGILWLSGFFLERVAHVNYESNLIFRVLTSGIRRTFQPVERYYMLAKLLRVEGILIVLTTLVLIILVGEYRQRVNYFAWILFLLLIIANVFWLVIRIRLSKEKRRNSV